MNTLLLPDHPLAWAAAVSPTALSFFLIMISLSDNPRLAGISFYLGAIIVFFNNSNLWYIVR